MGRTHQVPVEKLNVGLALAGAALLLPPVQHDCMYSLPCYTRQPPTIKRFKKKKSRATALALLLSAPAFFCCRWKYESCAPRKKSYSFVVTYSYALWELLVSIIVVLLRKSQTGQNKAKLHRE
jgi:hypothetical protein